MKTPTQLYFDEIVKEVQALLKPLGFKKKALNFYRLHNGFHQLINIQKSAYNSAYELSFTMEICVDEAKESDNVFPSKFDLTIRERIGRIKKDSDIWYYLSGNLDLFKRKAQFAETKQEVLHDIEKVALPFFEKMNSKEKIEGFYED